MSRLPAWIADGAGSILRAYQHPPATWTRLDVERQAKFRGDPVRSARAQHLSLLAAGHADAKMSRPVLRRPHRTPGERLEDHDGGRTARAGLGGGSRSVDRSR